MTTDPTPPDWDAALADARRWLDPDSDAVLDTDNLARCLLAAHEELSEIHAKQKLRGDAAAAVRRAATIAAVEVDRAAESAIETLTRFRATIERRALGLTP